MRIWLIQRCIKLAHKVVDWVGRLWMQATDNHRMARKEQRAREAEEKAHYVRTSREMGTLYPPTKYKRRTTRQWHGSWRNSP